MSKEEFIREVTEGLMPPPQYFAKNAMMNKTGYESFDRVLEHGVVPLSPAEFIQTVEDNEALILDVRNAEDWAAAHIPGSIYIGLDGSFAPWVGALISDLKQAIVLLTPDGREEETVTRLSRVGYDNTLGYLAGGIEAWKMAGRETDSVDSIPASEFEKRYLSGQAKFVLDVRKPSEFISQHVVNAVNFPLDYINNNMYKLYKQNSYYLQCRSGYRSMVAASILKARGFNNVIDLAGGWLDIEKTTVPKTAYVCPTTISPEVMERAVEEVV